MTTLFVVDKSSSGYTPTIPGNVIMTGPAGDEWPVDTMREFRSMYEEIVAEPGNQYGICRAKPSNERRAIKMNHPFRIYQKVDSGKSLLGQAGSWMLLYAEGSKHYWPITADIFELTYTCSGKKREHLSIPYDPARKSHHVIFFFLIK